MMQIDKHKGKALVVCGLLILLYISGRTCVAGAYNNESAKEESKEQRITVYTVADASKNVLCQKAIVRPVAKVSLEEGQTGVVTAKIQLSISNQDITRLKEQVSEKAPLSISFLLPEIPLMQYEQRNEVDILEWSLYLPDYINKEQNVSIKDIMFPKGTVSTWRKDIIFRLVDPAGIEQYALFYKAKKEMTVDNVYVTLAKEDMLRADLLLALGGMGVRRSKEITYIRFHDGREENRQMQARLMIDPQKEWPLDSYVSCYSCERDEQTKDYRFTYLYSCQLDRNGAIHIPYKAAGDMVILRKEYNADRDWQKVLVEKEVKK